MLQRFSHLLVPVDLSPRNRAALDIAFEIAVENKARISLLHVVEQIGDSDEDSDEEISAFYEQLRQRAQGEIETFAQRFSQAGVDTEVKVLVGHPLREIIRFADSHNVDLIVMSSHPVDPEDVTRSLGTLSYKVSIACSCPILLVKQVTGS